MEQKYQYASMREYTEMGQFQHQPQHHQLNHLNDNDRDTDASDIDVIEDNMDLGRGRKTANDCKQWIFVVKRTKKYTEMDETEPLLNLISATDALNALHHTQTRNTLELDLRRTDLHISPAKLPASVPSPVPNVDFLYVGISEKRMKYWCDKLEYQLNLDSSLIVEWLLMIDNQLAHATHNDAIENRQFNLQCWRDLYVRYYSQYVNEEIYKFYRKYGYGYDESYAKDQFHIATDDNMYSRDISQGSIFREVDRIRLTKFSFQSNLSSTMNNGYMSSLPMDEIDKRIKDKNNVLIDAFPCHEYDVLADIYQQIWSTIKCTSISTIFQIPLAGLRDYYGEKIAYYFLFLVSYTQYMIPLASVGFFFQIYQFTNDDVEVELVGFFAILILIWGAIVPLLWRQQESRYACKWGQYSNETSDPEHLENTARNELSKHRKIHYLFVPEMERVEFVGKPRRSTIDGAIIKTDDELQKIKHYCASYGLLLVVILSVTGLSVTIVIFELFIEYYISDTIMKYGSYGFGVLNAFCMLLMEYISLWFIPMINNYENHRSNIQYKKAFMAKKLTFDFINYYVSLLFIVFVVPLTSLQLRFVQCSSSNDNCLIEIQTHFVSVFATLILCRLLVYLYNFTCGKYSFRKMKRVASTAYFQPFYDIDNLLTANKIIPPSRKPELTANEYLLYNYEGDVDTQGIQKPLNEFLIQFGYLITFGLFFPWAAPISLFYNLLVLRLELHKLVVYSRRPFPCGACGIGFYASAFKMMTMVSILVVFYVFTVDSYELRLYKLSSEDESRMFPKLLDWIALIVIFCLFYLILLWLFPSVPNSAKDHILRQMFVDQSICLNYGDMKSYQESITVSSLLRLPKWTVNEVYDYFDSYGHPRYATFAKKIILKKQICGEKLLYLTKRDLQLFGIQDQYHRMWIEKEIESLKLLHRNINSMMIQRENNIAIDSIHMDTLRAFMTNQQEIEENEEENKEVIDLNEFEFENLESDHENIEEKEYMKFIRFGNVKIGKLTASIGGKLLGDIILLSDIIKEFQTVIKQQGRMKLIKSFASKKIKINEFKSSSEIYGLLELIILLVIKLKYKGNVDMNKNKFKQELNPFIQWIINDKDTMNNESWNIDHFANVFDDWIAKIVIN